MNKYNLIMVFGFIVLILPYIGFPQSFDNVLYSILGILIFTTSYLLKKEINDEEDKHIQKGENSVFSE